MFEFRNDAPIGSLIFWSIALVVWIVVRIRSKKGDVKEELKKMRKENSE